ncbi:MAG TPA: CDC48 family AAA ATPase [Methanoregula sp.]|mgnify:CR=1 FL=1|nr:CDC48 family AAA ATPase [Methanoregula sp.]
MTDNKGVKLTVQEALSNEDVGRNIAILPWRVIDRLNLSSGDVIEIEGLNKTYAIAYPSQRTEYIHIDGYTRRSAGVGIGETVTIREATVKDAKSVEFQVASARAPVDAGTLAEFLKENLMGQIVVPGQSYRLASQEPDFEDFFSSFGGFPFGSDWMHSTATVVTVTAVEPQGAVRVVSGTKIKVGQVSAKAKAGKAEGRAAEEEQKKAIPDIHYEDIGGLDRELKQVQEMIELPLRNPEIFEKLGIEPPKGVLLYGPPGTGKTMIAKAVANEVQAHFITISGPEIMNKYYGESEGRLREIFDEAEKNAPSIIFIDEIDSIAPKREETKGEVERRVVAQLLALMDGLKSRGKVIVIAATNLPDSIDPALRRGGRFDREIEIGIPDIKGRLKIFQIHARNVPLEVSAIRLENDTLTADDKINLNAYKKQIEELEKQKEQVPAGDEKSKEKTEEIAKKIKDMQAQLLATENGIKKRIFLKEFADQTHGFVGADISLVVKEAAMHALRAVLEKTDKKDLKEGKIDKSLVSNLKVTAADFRDALLHVEPSAMREVLVEVPDITWKHVGGLEDTKQALKEAVEWPIKYPDVFERLQTKPPKGILLFGPPGTGKTLLAKAVANESECNFISVKGPELLSKWVGESEKGVREIFRKARQAAPSIIFFDEVDALVPKRGSYMGSSHVTESVVSQILTELDGMEELKNVTVLAATNRPDMLDDALLRPGRLERHIYVPAPDEESRKKIFEVYLGGDAGTIIAKDVNIDDLVTKTKGFVGADIEALVREAKMAAVRQFISVMGGKPEHERNDAIKNVIITKAHFDSALTKVKGSLDDEAIEKSERQAWGMLYSSDQKEILERGATAVRHASTTGASTDKKAVEALKTAVYATTKDFDEIKKLTEALEKNT